MAVSPLSMSKLDPVWERIRVEAAEAVAKESLMGGMVHSSILHHETFEAALAHRIAMKLASPEMSEQILRELAEDGASLMIAHASGYNTAAPEIAAELNVAVAVVDTPDAMKPGLVADYTLSGHEVLCKHLRHE